MVEVAAACVRHSSARRPRMGQVMNEREAESSVLCFCLSNIYQFLEYICQVVRAFDGLATCDLSNGVRVGDSTQQSAEIRLLRRIAFGNQDYNSEILATQV